MKPASARGNKQACSNCSTRFYDLNTQPAVCPKCFCIRVFMVNEINPSSLIKPRRKRRIEGAGGLLEKITPRRVRWKTS
jgi:hypothetical protein